ncbi:apoptosis-resistant E3 ubiquitin protein ligase 1 isoform X2 [Pectinophora gossypiella]|uniref:apoptosis-resistant E3 ubiquitin protein ligase 1 isoform X2 n=1 Tax=Pectinophora gossypiella TaxID=13191 RepID=UPI00214F4957|nr:apoptosis-resistant E3 ubiquitin protein ligase 1 isoform X2 [Pectinophora gossypiella]
MFHCPRVHKLDVSFAPGMWQFEDSEICSIGMIHPSHSRNSGLSMLSGVSQFSGISTLSGCGSPEQLERLPELPAAEEKRLRRAAQVLQQRLVLRQWLATHRLQHAYSKLLSLDVSSLEDVYWLEDSTARHVLQAGDFPAWSAARQSLPTGKEALQALKQDLWSVVVKSSKHQDAWTWGGMLVVSVSVCGLVTLAAMTQPSLAPEAKHSLLQYVTGKYLHPPSCRVEWGWTEPQPVGETMCFTVHCFQRNGQPYPICDTDELTVCISHGTRKITAVVELGSGDPAQANTARVKFTVRTATVYIISVMIGGVSVCGSPFRKWFTAGPALARRSRLARAQHALVCCAGHARQLHVHPRDQYDNPAPVPDSDTSGFTIELSPLGGEIDQKLSQSATFQYDSVNQRVTMSLCFDKPGIYRAALYYEQVLLQNGQFDCIVLTASDTATVARNISSKRHSISYEARLLSPGRPRRVLCCLGPKHLTVKDYILKFIPKRITSFRLCPSTKLIMKPSPEGTAGGEFTLEDGAQPSLVLASAERDLIAATFTQLLIANCGGEDTFKNKQDFFYSEIRKVHARHPHDKIAIRVARAELVRSSLKATKHFTQADWCKNFDVSFQGEQGVDWGGVRREWFSLLCGQLFDAKLGLFVSFHDSATGLVHPNPDRPPHLKLKHFELAGKLVGKCLYESALGGSYRQLVRARLTRSFLAQIIGLRVHYKYFEQDDPELYLSKIKYVLETDLDAGEAVPELYFSDDVYDSSGRLVETRDLIPGGANIRVRNATKREYLDALAQWRLAARCRAETDAFLRGLTLLVPDNLLAIFDENELELLVCGTGEVSVADWRAHALVSGAGRDWERLLAWFWAALANLSTEERARLLQFTTGCSQLPPGGFQELNPRFQITAAPTFGALPTAHTCFNQLCLPDYDSYEQLVHALLWAINEGGEGFGMI